MTHDQTQSSRINVSEKLFSRAQPLRRAIPFRWGIAGASIFLGVLLIWTPFEKSLGFNWYQLLLQTRSLTHEAEPMSVVLEVGDRTIQEFGPWPWNHKQLAELINFFSAQGVYAVFLDTILQSEDPESDALLEKALIESKAHIYTATYFNRESGEKKKSIPRFAVQLKGQASIETEDRVDGVSRYWLPFIRNGSEVDSLHAAAQILMDELPEKFDRLEWVLKIGKALIPWTDFDLRRAEKHEYFDWISGEAEVAKKNGKIPDQYQLSGRIVWVGSSTAQFEMSHQHELLARTRLAAMLFEQMRNGQAYAALPFWAAVLSYLLFVSGMFWMAKWRSRRFWIAWGVAILSSVFLSWFVFHFFKIFGSPIPILMTGLILGLGLLIEDLLHSETEKQIFFYLATRDGLTQLYGIRHFRLMMNQLAKESFDVGSGLALILIDIDCFKHVNDTYGHLAGDEVIKKVADTITMVVRQRRDLSEVDFVARYGGDEFMVLSRRTDLRMAQNMAERIRDEVSLAVVVWQDKEIRLTVSSGVGILNEGENIPDAMVHRADKALYLSKQKGRNRVSTEEDVRSA